MKGRIPSGWGRDKLSDFIENANQNTIATFANLRPIFKKLQDIDGAFRKIVDNLDNTREWFEGLFLLRAHSSYLGAVRLSTSGQVPETYMVLRGCIENSLYGLYLHKKPEEREIWLKRHDDDESKRRVRRKFKITSMLDLLESSHASTSRVARELYEDTIDYGAHPNERTITSALQMKKEERVIRFDLTCLSGDSPMLRACLKINAQIGVCSLLIFKLIFRTRFDLLGVSDDLVKLQRGL